MRTIALSLSLLALGLGLAQAQPAANDPKRFLSVPKWYVTYVVTVRGHFSHSNRDTDTKSGSIAHTYRGGYATDFIVPDAFLMGAMLQAGVLSQVVWGSRQPGMVGVSIADSERAGWVPPVEGGDLVGADYSTANTYWMGRESALTTEKGSVHVNWKTKTYSVALPCMVSSKSEPVQMKTDWHDWSEENQRMETGRASDRLRLNEMGTTKLRPVKDQPLPAAGLDLSGEMEYLSGFEGNGPRTGNKVTVRMMWTCSPDPPPDVELQLDPRDYDDWRPGGAPGLPIISEGQPIPNSALRVGVELVNPMTGGPPKVAAKAFHAELIDVSRQPGVAINAPRTPASPPDFDLKLTAAYGWTLGIYGQKATNNYRVSSTVLEVNCHDYGAWGTLKVTADLVDGREVTGYLTAHRGEDQLKIPERTGESKIADGWKQQHEKVSVADDADDENIPAGDGSAGDGLTLYEEYRGLSYHHQWREASPIARELFVCDQTRDALVQRAAERVKWASKVWIRYNLAPDEMDPNRVINFNARSGPHVVDQHAVLIRPAPGPAVKIVGGPGTPKSVEYVLWPSGANRPHPRFQGLYINWLAQCIAMCMNVRLHGAGDYDAEWSLLTGDEGNTWIEEQGVGKITVLDERLRPVPWATISPGGDVEIPVYCGVKGGEHSGNEACLMRWSDADCYVADGNPAIRYWISGTEVIGDKLCEGSAGTGCNDPLHGPQSRYGMARVGNCLGQIHVSDR